MNIFRWVDPDDNGVVTLDMNALAPVGVTEGFGLLGDLDLGIPDLNEVLLGQAPHNGVVQTGVHLGPAMARFRLKLQHTTRAGFNALLVFLRTELLRNPGCIEFRPEGMPSSFFIDTIASSPVSAYFGQENALYEGGVFKQIPRGIPIAVKRQPDLRGAGVIA